MLKWIKTYWPILIIVALMIAALDVTVSSLITCHPVTGQNHKTINSQKQDECTTAAGPVLSILRAVIEFLDDHGEAVTAIFTLILAAFTGTLWWSTNNLWVASEQQLKLARDEFLSTHRPKIRIKAVFLTNQIVRYEEPITIRVACVNTGATDAVLVSYGISPMVVPRGVPLPPDWQTPNSPVRSAIPSGITITLPTFDYSITENEEVRMRHEEADLYCLGYLHYLDGLGRSRLTHFCRRLLLEGGRGRFIATNDPDYEYAD